MPNMRSRLRSELPFKQETQTILEKIAVLYGMNPHHVVFETEAAGKTMRYNASNCTLVQILPFATSHNIQFKAPGDSVVETYALHDIHIIRRLRNKKWLIRINGNAVKTD